MGTREIRRFAQNRKTGTNNDIIPDADPVKYDLHLFIERPACHER